MPPKKNFDSKFLSGKGAYLEVDFKLYEISAIKRREYKIAVQIINDFAPFSA